MRNILILALLVFSDVPAMPEESLRELQSEELRRVYRENPAEDLQQLIMSEESREHMLQQALFYAGRVAPVDNRAYLFALAADLYHSLPPGPDPGGYEPGELGGKGDLMRQFQKRLGADRQGIEPDRDEEWETLLLTHKGQPDRLAAPVEIKYIQHYFREHIELDDFTEHASVAAEELSFSNPTHYAALRSYMDSMQHRIRSGIPPWEDLSIVPDEPDGRRDTTPTATVSSPAAKPAEPAAPAAAPVPEQASRLSPLVKLAIAALLIAGAALVISRGRRR